MEERMESKIRHAVPKLRLLKTPIAKALETSISARQVQNLEHFVQLQIDQLASHPDIQWAAVIYQDSQLPDQRQALEASQTVFTPSDETLTHLQTEKWLLHLPAKMELEPITADTIESGFYYIPFGDQNQPCQYLLTFIPEPLSYTCRQSIRRTAMGIHEYLNLHQQNWQHRQQIQTLEEIVQRVGHQLRHPLALISLYSKNLKRLMSQGKMQEQISVICKTTDCLNQNLTEMMQCASSRQLQLSSQDLRSLVLKTLDEFQGWICEKQLQIRSCDRPLKLNLDPLQIKEALSNLLSNAIYFSPHGATLFIDWKALQGNVMLTLRDEGPGLSAEDLQKLFKPFYTRRQDGTGLGLAIAHKIVLEHGGQLSARNVPEKGAEFSMTLPRFMASMHCTKENTAC
jgi:signal transduction histidine kinase